jgi:putative two-component system response regulator
MRDELLKQGKILIVDDQEANVRLLERILERAGYKNLTSTTDSRRALPLFGEFEPDVIILDLHMPHLDGFAVMEELCKQIPEGAYLPILVLTADETPEAKQRALSMGARDFLTKPFDHTEALLRIRNLIDTRFLHLRLQRQDEEVEVKVRERTSELSNDLEKMSQTAEHRRMLLASLARAELRALDIATPRRA